MEAYERLALSLRYALQRGVVGVMFHVLGRLLVAGSRADAEIVRELHGFPDQYTIAFSILGDPHTMRLRVIRGRFVRVDRGAQPDLEIVFKHITHAFLVLTFRESPAQVYANDRAITHGDVALAMRFVRCLTRAQAIALPSLRSGRSSRSRASGGGGRLRAAGALYGQLVAGLLTRTSS